VVSPAAYRDDLPLRQVDEHDVRMSSLALMAYASACWRSAWEVLAPGYFARQDTARRCALASGRSL